MNLVSAIEQILNQVWRHEINSLSVAYDEIARHHCDSADSDRNIYSRKHDVSDRGRIDRFEVCRHINFREPIQVADAAVHDQSAVFGGFHGVVKQIVPNDGPIHFLSEEIDD